MMLFVGVDGGGTKTETLICNENGVILGRGTGGPSNPLFVDKSVAMEAIRQSIREAAYSGQIEGTFDYAAICVPGMRKYGNELKEDYASEIRNICVTGDELSAFYSALAKPFGIVVLSGTGSFAMGVNRKGESAEMGGWGPVLGDEGSGYYMGLSALKAVIREYEDRSLKTSLTEKLKEYFGISEIPEIRHLVYNSEFDRLKISQISKIVYSEAAEGDAVSVGIIKDAAKHLASLVKRMAKRLNMYDGEYDAVLTGGVTKFGDFLIKPFIEYVKKGNNNINVRNPKFKPSVGSLMIAMKEAGIDIYNDLIINNLEVSYNDIILLK
ncbi:MAG: hypothetical protein HPY74_00665 [Firmicutes bacterium]|nr:hypothetical protein [Bacillota bacterium]